MNMGNENSHVLDIELKGNRVLNIHEDAIAIIYLQVGEIPIRLIPKERDQIVHRAKWFKWEVNSFLWVCIDEWT